MVDWNDIELVDGRFYMIEINGWHKGHINKWIYSFRANLHCNYTQSYVSAYLGGGDLHNIPRACMYTDGRVCSNNEVLSIREATNDEVRDFVKSLRERGYHYNLNTRKVRDYGGW